MAGRYDSVPATAATPTTTASTTTALQRTPPESAQPLSFRSGSPQSSNLRDFQSSYFEDSSIQSHTLKYAFIAYLLFDWDLHIPLTLFLRVVWINVFVFVLQCFILDIRLVFRLFMNSRLIRCVLICVCVVFVYICSKCDYGASCCNVVF